MMVYVVALLDALIYLSAVPVCAAFCLNLRDGLRAGAGVGAFQSRGALRRARRQMARGGPVSIGPNIGPGAALRFVRGLRVDRVSLQGRLGLGDAAATALACGALTALGAALRGRAASLEVDVAPLFDVDAPTGELRGMIRARAGQIIIAAARSGIRQITGRIAHGKASD